MLESWNKISGFTVAWSSSMDPRHQYVLWWHCGQWWSFQEVQSRKPAFSRRSGSWAESVSTQAPGCCTKTSPSLTLLGNEGMLTFALALTCFRYVSSLLTCESPALPLSLTHSLPCFSLSHLSITYSFITVAHAAVPGP